MKKSKQAYYDILKEIAIILRTHGVLKSLISLKTVACGKRLYPTESVKYLGVKIDANLMWHHHVNDLSIKLLSFSK